MFEELSSIGLTPAEISIYLALLKLGPSTNSPITRQTQLQSSTVYYCLNSLIEKGFASYILKGNRHVFNAVDPEQIPRLLEQKKEELEKQQQRIVQLVPKLKGQQNTLKEPTVAEVYEGFRGLQTIFNQLLNELKRGDTYEAFVIEQSLSEPSTLQLLFQRHNKSIKAKGIKLRLLASEQFRSIFEKMYGKEFLRTYQEIRYTPETTPVGITIYRNNVITHVSEEGKPISFKIRNKKLADAYRAYFNEVWKRARS
ncbi:MAG TPA: helix-turn-helix domain-containing protein [Candidatus Nanoarchaeia archaeon]|nr:helix-turn-helix domain-containing protein [Candidatus Nanoarchaeia archaeon]